jgi:hypothetical protein
MVAYAKSSGVFGYEKPGLLNLTTLGDELEPETGQAFALVAANRERFISHGGLLREQQRVEERFNQIEETREILTTYGISLPEVEDLNRNQQSAEADLTTPTSLVDASKASPRANLPVPSLASLQLKFPI